MPKKFYYTDRWSNLWRHGTCHYDTQQNYTQHNDTQHNDAEQNNNKNNGSQHNDSQLKSKSGNTQ